MTPEEAVAALDRLETVAADPSNYLLGFDEIHAQAEDVLRAVAPPEVQAAYDRVRAHGSWWYA